VAGLKHTMREVLRHYRRQPAATPLAPPRSVLRAADLFPMRGDGRGCMHCHQAWEGLRRQARANGTFDPESVYVYPLPENVGLQLDLTAGNKVTGILPGSAADRAGLRAGDRIETVQEIPIFSQGDVMWALHNAPAEGATTVTYRRKSKRYTVALTLPRGWKKTDLSWRASNRRGRRFGPR
jgi:hypothetical protein